MSFDASLLVIMAIFWVTYVILRVCFFKPMMALLETREGRVSSAQQIWDQAFADKANSMSVRVIEYKNTEQGRRLAYDCYQYLLREALPAVWPIQQGSALILYVGASSERKVLEDLREHVAKLSGPPPLSRPGEFADAFLVNIDDWVQR